MHERIETHTLCVPGKGRGFDIDPGQKASISLPPEARVQIKRPYPYPSGNKDENIKVSRKKDMYLNGELFATLHVQVCSFDEVISTIIINY